MSNDKKHSAFLRKMAARADNMEPTLISPNPAAARRAAAQEVLPEGASLTPTSKTAGGFNPWTGTSSFAGGGGSSMFHTQRPVMPEYDSPDRAYYPKSRLEANKYWRLFYKMDPIFGTAVDMYSQMMVSEFSVTLDNENDKSIKNQLNDMVQETMLLENLQNMVKEFLVIGECFPHCFFDDAKGVWSYIGFHNPDYMDVQDSAIIDMDPIVSFIPDEGLRNLLTDNSPESIEVRQNLPPEFVSKVLAHQKIRLSPLNCSYIPRKLHPYDERGVSLASRLWRIWMVEDAVYNSTIATFRRASSPLKVLKIGDPNTGWIPSPDTEQKLINMVTQAEMDPQCFVPETKVTLADGTFKAIGSLEIGEKLINKDGEECEVEVLQEEYTNELVEINVHGLEESIKCTPTHKWPVFNFMTGTVKTIADNFVVGDFLKIPRRFQEAHPNKSWKFSGHDDWCQDADFIYTKITKIVKIKCEEPQKVINMTVSGDHSYCVHNIGTYNSWIVYNYGVNFETWGNTDRAITISREHDTIEKVKLLALGLSKGFMTGDVNYSATKGGLQVFLRRLLSMRQFFESTWILPKFFNPIIQINDWTKSTPAEVNHRYRIKRTAQEKHEKGLYISPKLKWRNKLDPTVDDEVLRAYAQLKNFGFDVSYSSIGGAVSLDWEDEVTKKATEFKRKEEILEKVLGPALKTKYQQQNQPAQPKPPGGAGSGAPPMGSGLKPGGQPAAKPPGGQPGESHPPGSGSDSDGLMDDAIESPGSDTIT